MEQAPEKEKSDASNVKIPDRNRKQTAFSRIARMTARIGRIGVTGNSNCRDSFV
jgi:hypothetical protein